MSRTIIHPRLETTKNEYKRHQILVAVVRKVVQDVVRHILRNGLQEKGAKLQKKLNFENQCAQMSSPPSKGRTEYIRSIYLFEGFDTIFLLTATKKEIL